MTEKARDNSVHRLPDWRTTLPLAQACPRCGARTRSGSAIAALRGDDQDGFVLPHSGMLPTACRLPHRDVPVASSYSTAEDHT